MKRVEEVKKEVFRLFQENSKRAYRPKEVAKKLGYTANEDYRICRAILEQLSETGDIARVKGNKFTFREISSRLEGVLSVHRAGYGFVAVEGHDEDFFVRSRRMNTALDGDRVHIGLAAHKSGDQRQEAEILEVIKRGRTSAVGTFQHSGSFAVVIPDDRRLTHDIYVDLDTVGDAKDGDKVQVSIDAFEHRGAAPRGRILKRIGSPKDPHVQTIALAMSIGVNVDFEEETSQEASDSTVDISKEELGRRTDFRDQTVFTIDPVDAKDFDDALHIRTLPNSRFEVGIHIADVSHYVRVGSALDRSASERATSVYLVDQVIPMLPEVLSNGICSLKPEVDRLAFSCIVELDGNGQVFGFRVEESIINSAYRLSYEEAQAIIVAGGSGRCFPRDVAQPARGAADASKPSLENASPHPLAENLALLNSMAHSMRERRFATGSIDFGVREVRVELDESGKPVKIVPRERLDAHQLVEEFMLLANRLIATEYGGEHGEGLIESTHGAKPKKSSSETPAFVFRVHDPPDRERITQLAGYVRAFGHELPHDSGHVSPKALNNLLRSVAGQPEAPVIEQAALRSMSRARYDTINRGHYGLAVDAYTHFTSPIRRYPDLLVHRLIKARNGRGANPDEAKLAEILKHCSEREVVATEAERESIRLKKVEYVLNHVGEEYWGVISGVSRFGVYVELDELLVEGMVHVRDMSGDYYEYDESSFSLVGTRSGRRYRPGTKVRVLIASASIESREIDFEFV